MTILNTFQPVLFVSDLPSVTLSEQLLEMIAAASGCEADIKTSIHSKITAFVKSYKWNVETAYARVSHSQTDGQDWGFLHCLHKPEKQQQQRQHLIIPKQRRGKINSDLKREKWSFLFSFKMSLIARAPTNSIIFKMANFPRHLYSFTPGILEVFEISGLNMKFSGSSENSSWQLWVLYIQH